MMKHSSLVLISLVSACGAMLVGEPESHFEEHQQNDVVEGSSLAVDASEQKQQDYSFPTDGLVYVVKPGDSLASIADRYHSEVKWIRDANHLDIRSIPKAGLKLFVPIGDRGKQQLNPDEWIPLEDHLLARNTIENFREAFKRRDREAIAGFFGYPFNLRMQPLRAIQNRSEMVNRFDEVFDEYLMKKILDWSAYDCFEDDLILGAKLYQDLEFGGGMIWMSPLGQTGEFSIIAVNYKTEYAKRLRADMIRRQKSHLHASIQEYQYPVLQWIVGDHRLRIDQTAEQEYRLVVWEKCQYPTEIPELIVEKGARVADGTGGNHHYTFEVGELTYECHIWVLGKDPSDFGWVMVYRGDEVLWDIAPSERIED